MEMIILTSEQAGQVKGRHGKYSALEPIELIDGRSGLPVDVLQDPDLAEVKDFLSSLPIEEAEVMEPDMPEELMI